MNYNQRDALECSIKNNFASGIHYHATGTGKSWIALQLIIEFYKRNKSKCNILWLCESKSILVEQFNRDKIEEKGFGEIFKLFRIFNFARDKKSKWWDYINSFQYWNLSSLIIINRDYLTYNNNYMKIRCKIDLIIHDECHSILNKSTQNFYEYVFMNWSCNCIGFSATPHTEIEPFTNILTSYTIYDAFKDNIILPPKIYCLKGERAITVFDIIQLYEKLSHSLHYKKIIVWCGMIHSTVELAEKFKMELKIDYKICVDTSSKSLKHDFGSYEDFYDTENNALLFCAAKHREGSDIPNLDGCIFIDYVENRNSKTFVQCIGRVLRKDKHNLKKYGLIIDTKAKSINSLIDRMSNYFGLNEDICPWIYHYSTFNNLILNELTLTKTPKQYNFIDEDCDKYEKNYTVEEIKEYFIRKIPITREYVKRLDKELTLIVKKNLGKYLIQACHILKMTKNIPHVTRGSCGSSLVCYMLGISNIDPVYYNISFARFLNEFRNNLPDIDFDFPHIYRDEIFLKLHLQWTNKIARISNHVYYHEKSSLRQAIRNQGIHQFISKDNIQQYIQSLPQKLQLKIKREQKKLQETFKGYMLHCGGIVYFHHGIPKDLLMEKQKGGIQQVYLNKHQVSESKQFKIDILSSRGLSIVYDIFGNINFTDSIDYEDVNVFNLLCSGDNIGLTLAESPLMRKAFIKIQPKSIHDIAVCLSIIRPAAKEAKDMYYNYGGLFENEDYFIFDDDAIHIIQKYMKCSEDVADKLRREFSKGKTTMIDNKYVLHKLKYICKYSFCKAHAYSYAQLVYTLAYAKYYYKDKFWCSVLKHSQSMYKKWVHYFQAHLSNIHIQKNIQYKEDDSIYVKNRKKKLLTLNNAEMLATFGYWNIQNKEFYPDCYFNPIEDNQYNFRGIIASKRSFYSSKKLSKIVLFIGVQSDKFIEVEIYKKNNYNHKSIGIQGICIQNDLTYISNTFKFF